MMDILNYEIIESIADTPQSAIYKARYKKAPDRLLVLKILKAHTLSEYKKIQIVQKVEHLRILNDPLAITPVAFGDQGGVCFLTRDFFDGVTVNDLLADGSRISLDKFFSIACRAAQALEKVHQAGIIHGGVKAHNILVDPETLDVRLIDFISTMDVQNVSLFIHEPYFVRGTLAYTSPEQTGRINHRVVFASDLYSLGIVFYEMLAGQVPFLSDDPLELVHSHLAREAPRLHSLYPDIPVMLSNIVAKLMSKEPENRYQSASGLVADLTRCGAEYSAVGAITEFPLESRGPAYRATFISKMVGRDREAGIILDEYEQAARGAFRSLFVSGLPGIGKTRLIQELQKPMVEHRGYFTSGKFDIYQKNIPYSSLTQAFRNLARTFLTESNERIALWKDRILQAVGQNGKVLTDVIPELEILIGKQPDVQPLPPVESLHRFHDVFGRFLTCLATKENPLILFIDDLQWCDAASFDFLSQVFNNYQDYRYLFLLGAYRYNEVDPGHPLSKLISITRQTGQPLKEIRLEALKPEHCHEMVSYILDSPPEQTRALAEYTSALTEGNPLFVRESLAYLYNEGLLHLDRERQWRWDIDKIRESHMPTTVVALFSSKIQKMHPDLVNLLEHCACIGNTFSPDELALILEMNLRQIFEMLKPALEQGLVIENGNCLQFVHDRVQEAVLSAIPAERRRWIHWEVGTRLRAAIPKDTTDYEKLDNLFAIVAHLDLGIRENPDPETAYLVSDLNYHAGNKALDSLAVEAANKYFNLSRELLPEDCWGDSRYERTFNIFRQAAKTELMCGNHEQSERLLDELLGHAMTDLDRAECLAERTVSLSSIGNFVEAIETANRGLAYFGKAIPGSLEQINRNREELMAEIAAKDIDIRGTLLNAPFTTDREKKVETAFYSELLADLYFSGRLAELYLVAAQATLHALAGGMDEAIIYGFTSMGIYHGEREEFEQSFLYEDLTHDLAAKYPNTFAATKCMNGATWTLMHTRSHPRDIIEYSLKAFQYGKDCGDINNAAIAYAPVMWNLQIQGADLQVIEGYVRECLQYASKYHVTNAIRLAEATQAGWVVPMTKDDSSVPMDEKLEQWEQENHYAALGSYCLHRALVHYYFGEYQEAERELVRAEKYVTANSVLKREWHVFQVLNAIKLYENGTGFKTKRQLMAKIKPIIAKIEKWASYGPLFRPYLAFIRAELAKVTGTFREARSLYLDAINAAHEQEYTLLAGHLNECLGELFMGAGQHSASIYFDEALRLYRACRAEGKEARLTGKYEKELTTTAAPTVIPSPTLPDLDVEYLMKSSLAISAEVEQQVLLNKVMDVVIESSGAQHGYILIEAEGNLRVRAESHATEQAKAVGRRLEDVADICKAIVRYVFRTGERMLLNNASREGAFKDNPEVQSMQLCSVLCLPVVKQSKTVGILYLENRLADSVFTPEKTRMTELLTSQAAVSLENATLFDERKKAEEALRASMKREQFLADLVRNASVPIATGCMDGRLGICNVAFQKLTGYSEEELESVTWNTMLTAPEWRGHEEEKLAELHRTKRPVHYEKEYIRKDGSRVPVELVVHSFFDDAGNIPLYFAFITDITERKQMEDRLQRSYDELEMRVQERTIELTVEVAERKKAEQTAREINETLEQRVAERTTELRSANETLRSSRWAALNLMEDALASRQRAEEASVELRGEVAERKRAEEALRQYAGRLRFLHEADEAILAAHSAEDVAQAVVQHVPRLLPCQRASVAIHHPEANALSLLASYQRSGHSSLARGWRGPADSTGDPVLERLMHGERCMVEDLQVLPSSSPLIAQLRSEGVRAQVYEPIMIRGQFVGMLGLGMDAPGPLPSRQLEVIRELVNQLAIGLEQARLHEEVQRYAGELEQLVQQRTAALEASETRFRTIFEEAAIGIALADAQGRLVATNPALQRLLGYGEQELAGVCFFDFLDGADGDKRPQELLVGQRSEYTLEQRYTRKGGEVGEANVTVSLLRRDASGLPLVLALVEDITERKHAQQALIQAERLAIMGRMAASLAHEVNNPIQSVVGCLGLAMELLEDGEDADPFMNVAMEELERASRIVRQMRDLGRREQGHKEPGNVGELVEKVLILIRKQAQNRNVEVSWEGGDGLPPVPMVRDRIQQVFLNLVLNAIDAMPQGGALRIRAARTEEPSGVGVSFADTGVGIAPEAVQRLFEAFHSTKEMGLGLGLYVSRNIVQEHGGRIDVQSQAGQGSIFAVWLPVESE